MDSVLGNGPVIVNKYTQEIVFCGGGRLREQAIGEYETKTRIDRWLRFFRLR